MKMKSIVLAIFSFLTLEVLSQNPVLIPDTLSGTNFYLNIHPDSVQFLPGTKTFTNAFNQYSYLGPTLILQRSDVLSMYVLNQLSDTTTVHWHGLHVPAMADGGPHSHIVTGNTWTPQFEVRNNASTFWYHPHMHMMTGKHLMRGAIGMIIVRDSVESSINLPRSYGIDDFPIMVQSQQFDANNQIDWRGMHDSILLVNGTTNPMLDVPGQVVRLRLLNAAQERNFNFGLTANKTFFVIGNDGGLLNAPVSTTRIRLSPGERVEILVDFSGMNGQTIYLMSYASEFPMGVQGGTPMPGMDTAMASPINGIDFNILQLNVTAPVANPVTVIPASLATVVPWTEAQSNITRQITISALDTMSMDGPFYFNGQLFDMNRIDYQIPLNNIEIWSISNQTMVAHPFHIHDVQFFVLDRDGISVQPKEAGYKDVVMIAPQETVRFITKFEDFADSLMPYMYHCHILMHEDDGMMGQFVVVPNPNGINEIISSADISIFPNPTDDLLNITCRNYEINSVSVIDAFGRRLFSQSFLLYQNEVELNSSDWNDGVYFVTVNTKRGTRTLRLLVDH